jgi:tetratricopeptide (TPR) repeat protein
MRGEALGFALTAASEGEESGGVQEAIQYLFMALEDCVDEDLRTDILYRLGMLLHQDQDFARAIEKLEIAIPRLRAAGRERDALVCRVRLADSRTRAKAGSSAAALEELARVREEASVKDYWEPVARALDVELHIHDRVQDVPAVRRVLIKAWQYRGQGSSADQSRFFSSLAIGHYYGLSRLALASAITAVDLATGSGEKEEIAFGLNRLILALMERGQLNLPTWRHLTNDAPSLVETAGNRFVKFSIRENLAIWFMDSGELDRSRLEFQAADRLLGGHSEGAMKFMSLFNWAELAFRTYDAALSRNLFQAALKLDPPDIPIYGIHLARAGLGLAHLHLGELREAREIRAHLPPPERTYHFDPSALVLFSTRWIERTEGPRPAARFLQSERTKLRKTFFPTWAYLGVEEVRLLSKFSPEDAAQSATVTAEHCEANGMAVRAAQLRELA